MLGRRRWNFIGHMRFALGQSMEEMSFLEAQWGQLRLSEEEQETTLVDEMIPEENWLKEERSLLEKIYSKRSISKEMIRMTMWKSWRVSKPAIFKEVGKTIFAITFAAKADKLRVIEGKPWLFDNNFFCSQRLGWQQITRKDQVFNRTLLGLVTQYAF